MSQRKASYLPTPTVPPELMPRLAAIIEVLAGLKTVSEAARSLGLSRNHFQTILHRGVLGLVGAITVKTGGRPAKPPVIATLQRELKNLERENARLKRQTDSTERLLEVASGLLHGRIRPTGRQRRSRKATGASGERGADSDPDARRRRVLEGVDEMRRLGLSAPIAAAIAGVHAATVRRWRAGVHRTAAPVPVRTCVSASAVREAESLVRRLHGLIGADALRHSVAGLSRRAAASIKHQTLTALERERKAALRRVTIRIPGVLRGLDAMHLATRDGPLFALIGADGAVPYRTSVTTGVHYDAPLVARALRSDFEHHGAPLILRLDRASAHAAPPVREVLDDYEVLTLHGPPRYPRFYGQLERQNREHRAWINALGTPSRALIEPCLDEMLVGVNDLWRRRSLHWQTATERWNARPRLTINRSAFREEVHDRAIRIARTLSHHGQPADLAERLAIERTLELRGYLRQELGGWC
jgi:transposase